MLNFDELQVNTGSCKSFQTGDHRSTEDGSFAHFSPKVNTIYKVRNHLKRICRNLSSLSDTLNMMLICTVANNSTFGGASSSMPTSEPDYFGGFSHLK
jgi:hypothetical protein